MSPAKIDHDHDQAEAYDMIAESMMQLGITDSHQDATNEIGESQVRPYERSRKSGD